MMQDLFPTNNGVGIKLTGSRDALVQQCQDLGYMALSYGVLYEGDPVFWLVPAASTTIIGFVLLDEASSELDCTALATFLGELPMRYRDKMAQMDVELKAWIAEQFTAESEEHK